MLFHPSKIPYISFKKSCFKYFSFSLSLILKSNLILMKSWKYQSVFKRNFFVYQNYFLHFWYIFNYLYNATILHFYVFIMCRPIFISITKWQVNIVLYKILYFVCQYTKHHYHVFQLSNILGFLYFFFWLVGLAVVNFFLEHCLFLLILSSPLPPQWILIFQ